MSAVALLGPEAVRLGCTATDRTDAVQQCGEALVALGCVEDAYVAAMHEREAMVSSFVGEGFALPHGTNDARALVRSAGVAFLQFPDGVEWDGQTVRACLAIAAAHDEHMGVMQHLARVLLDPDAAARLREGDDVEEILALLTGDPA